jgi:O-antigen/teichoic acid export membrane protein
MSRMGVMVIRQFGQDVELGYWSIAAQIADALLVLPATISLLLFPSLVRLDGKRRWDEYRLTLLRLGPLMGVLCLVSAAVAHPAIVFVFGERYAASSSILVALLPGIFSFGVASVASQFVSATGFPLSQVVTWICGALCQGVLSLILFPEVGVVGLAWIQSGCAAFVATSLIALSLIKRPRKS